VLKQLFLSWISVYLTGGSLFLPEAVFAIFWRKLHANFKHDRFPGKR
jgi:hypothetical protein